MDVNQFLLVAHVVGKSNELSICRRGIDEHSFGAADYHFRLLRIHHARLIPSADWKYLRVRGKVTFLCCAMGKKYTFLSAGKL